MRVILGISGSIAAYKACELCRLLVKQGHEVRVVMTSSASEFITPLTLQALSGNPVGISLLDKESEAAMDHISLAKWAEILVMAPASANLIARLAAGMADDLLTTLVLATTARIYLAPAMNQAMWHQEVTQTNLHQCQTRGMQLIDSVPGSQACGDSGLGCMACPETILAHLFAKQTKALRVLITAGPTHEPLDAVRYLANKSSGKMGYALATAFANQGAQVTLVSGPTSLAPPERVTVVSVTTAREMLAACLDVVAQHEIFIATAAVADFRPQKTVPHKLSRAETPKMSLELVANQDIIQTIACLEKPPFCVGFAAQTHAVLDYALEKLQRKSLDMICANNIANQDSGFGSDFNELTVITANSKVHFPKQLKTSLAVKCVALIQKNYYERHSN